MSEAVFVTTAGIADLQADMRTNGLSTTEYWKLIVMKREGDSMIAVRRIIQCIDACIEGRTTPIMREWKNHRARCSELKSALESWH